MANTTVDPCCWVAIPLSTVADVFDVLLEIDGKRWVSRGQSKLFGNLRPSIDRLPLDTLEKRHRERRSIDAFRVSARSFSHPGEEGALTDDIRALMVLQHYGVPTRLLDWSKSAFVAAYFAVEGDDDNDAELWAFDERAYAKKGGIQWDQNKETTSDGSGDPTKFDANLTAFDLRETANWVIAVFDRLGFPRQDAQKGAYTMHSRMGVDHADALANLLKDKDQYQRYAIRADLKVVVRERLHKDYGIWRGSLFPDVAGAAGTARLAAFPEYAMGH